VPDIRSKRTGSFNFRKTHRKKRVEKYVVTPRENRRFRTTGFPVRVSKVNRQMSPFLITGKKKNRRKNRQHKIRLVKCAVPRPGFPKLDFLVISIRHAHVLRTPPCNVKFETPRARPSAPRTDFSVTLHPLYVYSYTPLPTRFFSTERVSEIISVVSTGNDDGETVY